MTSADKSWRITPNQPTPMVDGTNYSLPDPDLGRVAWSDWSATNAFMYDSSLRGAEDYYATTPFDLGGGLGLDIGMHNGEARVSRTLFSIPSYGPPAELALTYSCSIPRLPACSARAGART